MRRCPYCAEKTITLYEQLGGVLQRYRGDNAFTAFYCPNCGRYSKKMLGMLGNVGQALLLIIVPLLLFLVVLDISKGEDVLPWIYGVLIGLFVALMPIYYFFVYFDKRTKSEREADARLTFAVTGEKVPRVKKWGIYLIRFPERGTNAHSPVLYGMVCGKGGKKGERTYTLRVIRADNMDLPRVGEAAWLITDSDKVVEGTVTATTPRKPLPEE